MLEGLVRDAWTPAIVDAREEARALGSATVEAEHVLLALCRSDGGVARDVLAEAGLGYAAMRAAVTAEFEASLEAVGVSLRALNLPPPAPAVRTPRWGAWARPTFARARDLARTHGDRRIESAHILLALLGAQAGTVPRALRRAGVEPADLADRTEAALDGDRGPAGDG